MPPIDPLGTFLCAGASAVTAEAVWGCPVNTCKIQLQQQTGAVGQSGMLSAARRVASQSGGPRGLWQGLAPALWRQVVYGQLRIGLYNALASRMEERGGTVGSSLSGKVALGAASGCGSALLANPFDLAMVRIQSEAHLPPARRRYGGSTFAALSDMVRAGGLRQLWRGSGPTVTRAAILTAAEQASYDKLKRLLADSSGWGLGRDSAGTHFVASFLAGLAASVVTMPVDIVKTRVMATSARQDGRGLALRTVAGIWKQDGFLGFYRGFFPYYLKVGPWAMVMFLCFEQYKNAWVWAAR